MSGRGRFIAFEGIDGCGKSTQTRRVAAARSALCAFEPGDSALGATLRSVVLDGLLEMTPRAELLVLAADRAQHVAQVIEPALAAGHDVVCDRFSGSTLAYQGYGRGLVLDDIHTVLAVATGGLSPDVTILLDCPVDVAVARRAPRPGDRFEGADTGFLDRVRAGFLELASSTVSWFVVDATDSLGDVTASIDDVLDRELP